jgi:CheY-like chemotaxis protein
MSDRSIEIPSPRVFIIEDNPADARLVEEGIEATGIDIDFEIIPNGQQAIERLTAIDSEAAKTHPDLILLDLNLPGKSGFEVLAAVRNETAFQDVPVVVVSSSESPEDIKRTYESEANAYVTKPADPDRYIGMIEASVDFWIANVTSSSTNE